jgi:hypothetical protein
MALFPHSHSSINSALEAVALDISHNGEVYVPQATGINQHPQRLCEVYLPSLVDLISCHRICSILGNIGEKELTSVGLRSVWRSKGREG